MLAKNLSFTDNSHSKGTASHVEGNNALTSIAIILFDKWKTSHLKNYAGGIWRKWHIATQVWKPSQNHWLRWNLCHCCLCPSLRHEESGDHFHLRNYPGCVQGSSMLDNSRILLPGSLYSLLPTVQNLFYNSNQLPTHFSLLKSRSSTTGHLKYQLTPVFRQQNHLLRNISPASVLSPHPQGHCRHNLCHDWAVLCIAEYWLQFVLSATFYELNMTFALNNTALSLQFCRKAHLKQKCNLLCSQWLLNLARFDKDFILWRIWL